MKLVLTNEFSNLLLLANGLLVILYLGAKSKKRKRAMKFGNYETLQKVAGRNFLKSSNLILITRLLAVSALILGLSGPMIEREVSSTNSDYVLALDSSTSMTATDLEPTRLEAAKDVSRDFANQLSKTVNIGVISFSGEVKVESRIEKERDKSIEDIDEIKIGTKAGTAIGNAIFKGSSMLVGSEKNKTLILVTDGRNNVGSKVNKSLEYAKNQGVKINTIGIGQNQESESFGRVNGVNATKTKFPNLNEAKLNITSRKTGGQLITVSNRSSFEEAYLSFGKTTERTDISIYFFLTAVVLLLLEWVLGLTRFSILP